VLPVHREVHQRVVERGAPRAARLEETLLVDDREVGAVVFGSDQGLVGQFNDLVTDFALGTLAGLSGRPSITSTAVARPRP